MKEFVRDEITYVVDDKKLTVEDFLSLVNNVWKGNYELKLVEEALQKTINITAWDNQQLIGCARILTDGYFFGTVPEILVLPNYQGKGIGKQLMELVWDVSPTSLFFGSQPGKEEFFEKLGYTKSIQSFQKRKERRKV
jgi:ribosomal protein S18 acetylase RimI-like enzyme